MAEDTDKSKGLENSNAKDEQKEVKDDEVIQGKEAAEASSDEVTPTPAETEKEFALNYDDLKILLEEIETEAEKTGETLSQEGKNLLLTGTKNPPEEDTKKIYTEEDLEILKELNEYLRELDVYKHITPEDMFNLLRGWANFEIKIVTPTIKKFDPPRDIPPAYDESIKTKEQVYHIIDYGNILRSSRAEDYPEHNGTLNKMHNTIAKMLIIVSDRKSDDGSTDATAKPETVIQISSVEESCLRFAYETCLGQKIAISNYEPGLWEENRVMNAVYLIEQGLLPSKSRFSFSK